MNSQQSTVNGQQRSENRSFESMTVELLANRYIVGTDSGVHLAAQVPQFVFTCLEDGGLLAK